MYVLEMAQRFALAKGLPEPQTLVTNPAPDVQQYLEIMSQIGRSVASRHDWQSMSGEATFTTVAAEAQIEVEDLIGPGQILKKIVGDTIWNRTTRLPVYGPLSRPLWAERKALVITGPYPQYRIRGGNIIFNPIPAAGQTCALEYVSKSWVTDSTGTSYSTNIGADNNLILFDENIMMAGMEWLWLRKKGLDYAQEFQDYEALLSQTIQDDLPSAKVSMSQDALRFSAGIIVPVGSWPA